MKSCLKNIFLVSLFFALAAPSATSRAEEWQELKGEHFLIYFLENADFAKEVSERAEVYYRRIAEELGYSRYSDFWTWNKRVKVYIYPDRASYLAASSQPQWSEGTTDYKNKQIISYAFKESFMDTLLPHEITHLIFRDYLGFGEDIPRWLDEGLAMWEEGEATRAKLRQRARELYDKSLLLSLNDIVRLDISLIDTKSNALYTRATQRKDGGYGVLVLSPDVLISTYYAQVGSVVGFLLDSYGAMKFSVFCHHLADGKSLDEALSSAYAGQAQTLDELEKTWRRSLSKEQLPAP